ncbi:uncharacterized protein Dyak_GE29205 [Drosophila yakuba]|uniref:Secreted protein n=1 Tax=Drosophila yakuba TaxID=7245 RepID=A0A0R1E3I0_DROYA|nr:uncharacterized protein Dyak_GE29205 [Drosophila yakuba]
MQFSWMKVAIYLLTFLTYAYSGYGSSTIVHLRDAIIAAEAIFGDVFKNLIVLVRKFRTGCKAAAKMLFTGTLTLGCRSYLDSQQRSCYCAPPKSSSYNGNRQGNGNSREKQQRQKYGWKDRNEI